MSLPRFSREYWSSDANCRKFMDKIAEDSNIVLGSDWKKVSLSLIRNNGGQVNHSRLQIYVSKGLLQKYQGSVASILRVLYSIALDDEDSVVSSEWVFQFTSDKTNWKILKQSLQSLFPETAMAFNCRSASCMRVQM